jgi:hypothetical protein
MNSYGADNLMFIGGTSLQLRGRSREHGRCIMAGGVKGRWQKFPSFIEYANDSSTFQRNTEDTQLDASRFATFIFLDLKSPTIGICKGKVNLQPSFSRIILLHGRVKWSLDMACEALATNQDEFKILLDGVINGNLSHTHLQLMEEHASHLWTHPCWANLSREKLPGMILLGFHDRGLKYYEYMQIEDPLDGLYWQLREFLRLGGEQRLRKCPVCEHFFIQSTARPQTYCIRKCRLNSNPSRREDNQESQRKHREKLIQEDLKRGQEAKARLRALGEEDLALEWVLEEAKINKWRWTSLRRWEEKKYGRPCITDLTPL